MYTGTRLDYTSPLLDDRLLVALVVWSLILSLIILLIIVVVVADRTQSPFVDVPFIPVFSDITPDTATADSSSSSDGQSVDTTTLCQSAASADVQSETWLRSLRDENWIMYGPVTVTVDTHRGSLSANQRSLRRDLVSRHSVMSST